MVHANPCQQRFLHAIRAFMTIKARIFSSNSRIFDCLTESGDIVQATSLAKLLKKDHLVVGDEVTLIPEGEQWTISEVSDRRSEIFRNIPREHTKKIIAANVDAVMIVACASRPTYKRGLVDRYLVRAHQWGLPALLIFNKMDLYEGEFDIKFEAQRVEHLGVKCFEVCAEDRNYSPRFLTQGFNELQRILKNNTAILLGQSGVGKSRLITELSGGEVELLSGDLGKVGKGMHTTTWAELVNCGDFTLVDSPGVRSMSLNDISPEELLSCFPDIAEKAVQCKFRNCQHQEESKGCYFNHLKKEDHESVVVLSRLESYLRILDEVKDIPDWERS
jgi:ribosome biogenesis GTPase / thiamine phosphate phosphatase